MKPSRSRVKRWLGSCILLVVLGAIASAGQRGSNEHARLPETGPAVPSAPAQTNAAPVTPVSPVATPEKPKKKTKSKTAPPTSSSQNDEAAKSKPAPKSSVAPEKHKAEEALPNPAGSESEDGSDTVANLAPVLAPQLKVVNYGWDRTSTHELAVFVGLKNKTGHPLALEVMTEYADTIGEKLNHASWIPFTLKPHEQREYRSASTSAEARHFLVHIRLHEGDVSE